MKSSSNPKLKRKVWSLSIELKEQSVFGVFIRLQSDCGYTTSGNGVRQQDFQQKIDGRFWKFRLVTELSKMTPEKYIAEVLPKLGGWCTPEKAAKLSNVIKEQRSSIFVEIGVFAGRSLFAAALSLPQHGIAIGIDPWKRDDSIKGFDDANKEWWSKIDHDGIYDECRATIAKLGIADKCHLIRSNSVQALSIIQRLPFFACLHVDGNHSEEASCFDVVNYVPRVMTGGVIFMDDCDWSTTQRAQSILASMADKVDMVGNCAIYRKKP